MKTGLRWLVVFLTPFSLIAVPSSTLAQEAAAPTPAAKSVCISRKSDAPDKHDLIIVVPAGQQSAMSGKGYSVHACPSDTAAFAGYKAKICELAAKAPQGVQDQFARANNASPKELCDLASGVTDQ